MGAAIPEERMCLQRLRDGHELRSALHSPQRDCCAWYCLSSAFLDTAIILHLKPCLQGTSFIIRE